jgi:hypothetical protein
LKGKDIFNRYEYFTPTPPSMFNTADTLVAARTGGMFKTLAVKAMACLVYGLGYALFVKYDVR